VTSLPGATGGPSPASGGKKPPELVVALDTSSLAEAQEWVRNLAGLVHWFKVGLELFAAAGPAALAMPRGYGARVFWDAKLHDIPHTVAGTARQAARAGVGMLTVHAGGGPEMVEAAVAACREEASALGVTPPLVVAVTVLTSLGPKTLARLGLGQDAAALAAGWASLAVAAGADGVVAAVTDVPAVRTAVGPRALIVTPGIRPAAGTGPGFTRDGPDDQARTATPTMARSAGVDFVVVGRPITRSPSPRDAAAAILAELGADT